MLTTAIENNDPSDITSDHASEENDLPVVKSKNSMPVLRPRRPIGQRPEKLMLKLMFQVKTSAKLFIYTCNYDENLAYTLTTNLACGPWGIAARIDTLKS